jgi:hypothetical protein
MRRFSPLGPVGIRRPLRMNDNLVPRAVSPGEFRQLCAKRTCLRAFGEIGEDMQDPTSATFLIDLSFIGERVPQVDNFMHQIDPYFTLA